MTSTPLEQRARIEKLLKDIRGVLKGIFFLLAFLTGVIFGKV